MFGFVGLASLVFLSSRPALASQLHAWKVLPRSEHLTELYFSDHQKLPTTFSADSSQALAFRIHNLEHQPIDYHYTITVYSGSTDAQKEVGSGHLRLTHDDAQSITHTIKIPPIGRRLGVRVNLHYSSARSGLEQPTSQTQAIHYWVSASEKKDTPKKEGS